MKLPKNFGGQGFGNMLKQAQQAMERAKTLNDELEGEMIEVATGPITVVYNGLGEMQKITIDKSVVDPEDVEGLEDLVVSAARAGFQKANALREAKTQEIMPNIPGL